jgi:putative nucleotidyltransferase with HDIG domain
MDRMEMNKKSILDDILEEDKSVYTQQEDDYLETLLDEINLISDEVIKSFVRSVLLQASDFWIVPSSFSGKYHPPDEHGHGGNVLHTIRVTRIADTMCDSYSVSQEERDVILAACLLHDITKGVNHSDDTFQYDPMHPYTVNKFVSNVISHDKKYANDAHSSSLFMQEETIQSILRLVRCHLGPWSPIPETYPITYMDYIVHVADNIASKLHTYIDDSGLINDKWTRQ